MIAKNKNVSYVECPICSTKVCFQCRHRYHGKLSCEANLDKIYMQRYGSKRNVSFCPMCKTAIERNKGCNHMICGFCRYEFCWICQRGATEASGHWDELSLTGCGATQLDGSKTKKNLEELQRKKLGKFFLIFMCFPFICMYHVPIFITTIFLDQTDNKWPNWLRYPITVILFVLGIPLGLISVPFALLWCIYLMFHECCYLRCCKKTRN